MTTGGLEFLVLVVSALSLFAGVLGWASWMESHEAKTKAASAREAAARDNHHPQFAQTAHRAF